MNLMQIKLLKAKGYEFTKTELKTRQVGGKHYVAIAIKNGKRAEASGRTIPEAESHLVLSVTAPGTNKNVEQWKREERFLRKMARRVSRD